MARLNETTGTVDRTMDSNLDLLRKRFLRQNRDIARSNSSQGLKIRQLEFEVQRLLSENLEVRSRIYQLENELQESKARRIADHAIEMKAKMEAQLVEWSELLNSLGTEPPMKRRLSPTTRTIAQPRQSTVASPSAISRPRKSREARKEAEELAEREGRMPPIFEAKTYPRRTMDGNEILALCAEAAAEAEEEAANSSAEIGPAPTSQFVEDEPVKTDSPYRPSPAKEHATLDMAASSKLFANSPSPKRHAEEPASSEPTPSEHAKDIQVESKPVSDINISTKSSTNPDATSSSTIESTLKPSQTPSSPSLARVGVPTADVSAPEATPSKGKRKLSVRDDESSAVTRTTKVLSDKPPALKLNEKSRKSVRTLSSLKNREKLGPAAAHGVTQRKVLGVKNANQEIPSPIKKTTKPSVFDEVAAAKADALRPATDTLPKNKGRAKGKKMSEPISIAISEPTPQPVINIGPEIMKLSLETQAFPSQPASPLPSFPGGARDTPPPADISMSGETSRPSRRARSQISYAEPSLRDKMRRPSKQLVDAVSVEGGHGQRMSIKGEDLLQAPSSTSIKHVPTEKKSETTQIPPEEDTRQKERQEQAAKSPLSEKPVKTHIPLHEEPARRPNPTHINHKRRKPAIHISKEDIIDVQGPPHMPLPKMQEGPVMPREPETQVVDPYDFAPSSPSGTEQSSVLSSDLGDAGEEVTNPQGVNTRYKPRRASTAKINYSGMQDNESRPIKPHTGSRKRASMVVPKKSRGDMGPGYDTNSAAKVGSAGGHGGAATGGGHNEVPDDAHSRNAARRRSMMI